MKKEILFVLLRKELEKKGLSEAEIINELKDLRKFYKENFSISEFGKLKNENEVELITAKELMSLFKISNTTLFRYIKYGKLPVLKIGKNRLFNKVEIIEWFNNFKKCLIQ